MKTMNLKLYYCRTCSAYNSRNYDYILKIHFTTAEKAKHVIWMKDQVFFLFLQ